MTFITIGELSLVGSIGILVVMLLRKLSRSRISYTAIVVLWQILLIRLILPASMPNAISPLGVIQKMMKPSQVQAVDRPEGSYQASSGETSLMSEGQAIPLEAEEMQKVQIIGVDQLMEEIWLAEVIQEEQRTFNKGQNSQVKNSQKGKALRQDWYEDYEVYGMTYDVAKDAFYYNGKIVRFFIDEVTTDSFRMLVRNNQGIVVKAVRDGQNKLTGLKQLQGAEEAKLLQEMFDDNCDDDDCEELDGAQAYKAIEEAGKKAAGKIKKFLEQEQSENSPTYAQDNPKADYKAYGVSYNADKKAWEWNGKVIRFLWDANKHWHVNSSAEAVTNGVKVKVVRDAKGNIVKLVEMSDKEYNKLKKNNAFLAKAL